MTVAKQLLLLSLATLAMFIVVGATSYYSVTRLIDSIRYLDRTQVVQEKLQTLMYRVAETASAERGYIITGQEDFLEPYKLSSKEARRTLADLKKLLADSPEQSARLADLEPTIESRLGMFEQVIAVYHYPGPEAAVELIRKAHSKRLMDEIRSKVGTLVATEKALVQQREQQTESSSTNSLLTLLFGSVLAIVLVAVTSFFTSDRMTRSIRSLVRSMENLDHGRFDSIPEITSGDEFGDLSHSLQFLARNLQRTQDQLATANARVNELAIANNAAADRLHDALSRLQELELAAQHFALRLESEKEHLQLQDSRELGEKFRTEFAEFTRKAAKQDEIGLHYSRKFNELKEAVERTKEESSRGLESASSLALHSRKLNAAVSNHNRIFDQLILVHTAKHGDDLRQEKTIQDSWSTQNSSTQEELAGLDFHAARLQKITEGTEHLATRAISCIADLETKWEAFFDLQTGLHQIRANVMDVGTRSLHAADNYFDNLREHLDRSTHNAKLARQLILLSENMRSAITEMSETLDAKKAETAEEKEKTPALGRLLS